MRNALSAAALLLAAVPALAGGPQDRKSRPFHLGTTMIPHDMSLEGIAALQAFVKEYSELVGRKLDDGIPWQEALDKTFYPEDLEKKIAEDSQRPEGKKVFLATTPLHKEKEAKADWFGAKPDDPRAVAWKGRDLDDPDVVRAYANWCRDLIRRFQPDYFAYATEVNQLAAKNPQRWKKFAVFAKEIYLTLKKENPSLPIFVTLNVETYYENETVQKKMISQVAPFSDYACVTSIPFFVQPNPAKIPKDYFAKVAAAIPGKPFAVAETCFIAEDLRILAEERTGKAAWQDDYLRFLLDEAARLNGKFVVWSIPRDCDALHQKLAENPVTAPMAEFFKLFKDSGLLDGEGRPRKSFDTWAKWMALPRK
jgi:hypothetical protein